VRPEYRSGRVLDTLKPQPEYPLIFNRVGILIAMKGTFAALDPADSALAADGYQVGEVILRANAFTARSSRASPRRQTTSKSPQK
jgi:hypothetical protein